MSKRIVVLGVSTFSGFLLQFLRQGRGAETIAVDRDEERINTIADMVDKPVIGNVRNRELLAELDVASADVVVVSLGDIEGSLVTVLYLKELGATKIVAKALNSEHENILRLLGVDTIIFPERETAEQVAFRLLHPHVVDSMTLTSGERIVEILADAAMVGRELDRRSLYTDFGVQLVLVIDSDGVPQIGVTEVHQIAAGDRLVLFGGDEQLEAFRRRFS